MRHDGSNSARARSARIRVAHDDEANQLDSMHRNAAAVELRNQSRVSPIARVASFLARARTASASPRGSAPTIEGERDAAARIGLSE
jgi:hypothetical protein